MICLAIVGSLVIFGCLASKKSYKSALCIALVFGVFVAFGTMRPEDYKDPDKVSKELEVTLARCGMTVADFAEMKANQTPLEQGGDFLVLILVFTGFFALAIVGNLQDAGEEKYAKQIIKKCLALTCAAMFYLLSLYAGVQLTLIPWIKKQKKYLRGETATAV